MARERVITREIKTYDVKAVLANTDTMQMDVQVFAITGYINNKADARRAIEKAGVLPDNTRIVDITEVICNQRKYSMPEELFVQTCLELEAKEQEAIDAAKTAANESV